MKLSSVAKTLLGLGAAALLCLAGFCYLMYGNSPSHSARTVISSDSSDTELWISVIKNKEKRWFDAGNPLMGAQFDGVIQNLTSTDVTQWKVVIPIPKDSYINSSWNGIYSVSDTEIVIYPPLEYNRTIEPNGSITFGFIMYAPVGYEPTDIAVTYYRTTNMKESPLYWILVFMLFGIIVTTITYLFFTFRFVALQKKQQTATLFIEQILKLFANTIEAKDHYTSGHSIRVSLYARELARRIGLSEEAQQTVYYTAILHDIGKIGVPDSILNKPGKLTTEEMKIMQSHSVTGAEILRDFDLIPDVAQSVRYHHEKYDGSGYPDGIEGFHTPLNARIICIADCFDAMTTNRCYRPRLSIEEVLAEFEKCSGSQFDPDLVPFIIEMIKDGTLQKLQASQAKSGIL